MQITLVVFNDINNVKWEFGIKKVISYETKTLLNTIESISKLEATHVLFWDLSIGNLPNKHQLEKTIKSKGNLWHIGSKIGLRNKPFLLDAIQPTSMLHLSIDNKINHSSWKNTFKGCLIEKQVLKNISLSKYSESIDILGLDFGYKAMKSGIVTRYSAILSEDVTDKKASLKLKEELLFIRNNFDTKAFVWTYITNLFKISPISFYKAFSKNENLALKVFEHSKEEDVLVNKDISTSIIIATLERYGVLKNELKELQELNPAPKEIIIVDQTPKEKRNTEFLKEFSSLPIIYLETNKIGQCSARNLGIKTAKSKFIWFLDDDMEEIPTNYLQKHLETIYSLEADISCGVPDEIGTNYINRDIPKIELSDGFPTNDVLVKRDVLLEVGGFDEKMNQLQSEDEELGLRCVKQGALSVKNNQLRIVHLRANRGGLRNHKVRKITFASSRKKLFERRLLHFSEIYLCLKHFNNKQVYNKLLLNIRGTFIVNGNIFKKSIKILLGIIFLPLTLFKLFKRYKTAKKTYYE
ncbi:glycosyltransferase family 2 protein [Polaribacter aestuariivivens]|uniref:Glycosyltransferase family 2 protein n=1 Tax=Polaribacter aestuariivivens TaxID=2304626 RepID=A0A5S3N7Q8_9FLAO|nr:glycosyltransferase family 2 protein [Polaribacter aestuariivivens]TMM31341.1 glycosyltransferase family 2 protein [Polaribacter aestuariivivens]